jgi:hypothetical protein
MITSWWALDGGISCTMGIFDTPTYTDETTKRNTHATGTAAVLIILTMRTLQNTSATN